MLPTIFPYVLAAWLIVLADAGLLPFDRDGRQLELMMQHQALLAGHAGQTLALLQFASFLRTIMLTILFSNICWPVLDRMVNNVDKVAIFLVRIASIVVFITIWELLKQRSSLGDAVRPLMLAFAILVMMMMFAIP